MVQDVDFQSACLCLRSVVLNLHRLRLLEIIETMLSQPWQENVVKLKLRRAVKGKLCLHDGSLLSIGLFTLKPLVIQHLSLFKNCLRTTLVFDESVDHAVVLARQKLCKTHRLFQKEINSHLHHDRLHVLNLHVKVGLVLRNLLVEMLLDLLVGDLKDTLAIV